MKTFKEFLAESQMNEVKISNTHALKYFKLIQKALGSRTMKTDLVEDVLEVKYDTVSLFFKEGYLVGFRDEDGSTYEVSRTLRSVKDLKSVNDIQKHLGAKKAPGRMAIPTQTIVDGNYEVQDAKAATAKLKTKEEFLKEIKGYPISTQEFPKDNRVNLYVGDFVFTEKESYQDAMREAKRYLTKYIDLKTEKKNKDGYVYQPTKEYSSAIKEILLIIHESDFDLDDRDDPDHFEDLYGPIPPEANYTYEPIFQVYLK